MFSQHFLLIFLALRCDYIQGGTIPDDGTKIVNGYDAKMEDYYYQASLRMRGEHFCGGSIISDRYILTAGHCIHPFANQTRHLSVQVGAVNVYSRRGQIFSAYRTYLHPLFDEDTLNYDVGLLEIDGEIDFTRKCRPIRVARDDKFDSDAVGIISGWGYKSEDDSDLSEFLQAAKVPLISLESCRQFYRNLLTDTMICAGYIRGEKDSCQGDSGGPLVRNREQIGIVSWGMGCARPRKPGVYTSTAVIREFIEEIAGIV